MLEIKKYNRSKTYLLPLLSEFVEFDMKFMKYLLNTYMFIDKYPDNHIGILHEFSIKDPEFTAYEHKLIKNEYFVELVDIGNKVLYIFKFPEIYKKEYELFKNGKYSEFGEDSKQLIIKFWTLANKGNSSLPAFLIKLKNILYKENKLKEIIEKELNVKLESNQELGEIVDRELESFKISEYVAE